MSMSHSRRGAATAALVASGLTAVLAGLVSAGAYAAAPQGANVIISSSNTDTAAKSSWFVDPRTPAQRRAEITVPKKLQAVKGPLRETRAVYRTRAGDLAVPMRAADGQTMVQGQAVTLDGAGLFEIRKTDLTAQARTQIKGLAGSLANASSVRCEGYADYAGTPKGAQQNAAGRAKAVCDLLAATNPGLRTTTKTYGGSWPAIVGGRADEREINRRVVVEMTDTRPTLPTTPPVTPVTPPITPPVNPPVTPPALQVPGAPTLLRVEGYDRTVRYALTPPASDGGSPVIRYEVSVGDGWTTVTEPLGRAGSAAGAGGCLSTCDPTGTIYGTLSGLTAETLVDLQVRAVNAIGAGAPSSPLSTAVYGRPSEPTAVAATVRGTYLDLSFADPEHTGGSPITAYQVSYDGGQHWTTTPLTDPAFAGGAPWTISKDGLDVGLTYDVRVRGVNEWGFGPYAGQELLFVTAPTAPLSVVATAEALTATLTVQAPVSDGGSVVFGYQVSTDNGPWLTTSLVNGVATLANQTPGVHTYRIRAVNAVGYSPATSSNAVTLVRPATIYRSEYMYSDGTLYLNAFFNKVPDAVSYEAQVDGGAWLPVRISINWDAQALGYIDDPICGATNCTADLTLRMRAIMTDGPGPTGPGFTSKRY